MAEATDGDWRAHEPASTRCPPRGARTDGAPGGAAAQASPLERRWTEARLREGERSRKLQTSRGWRPPRSRTRLPALPPRIPGLRYLLHQQRLQERQTKSSNPRSRRQRRLLQRQTIPRLWSSCWRCHDGESLPKKEPYVRPMERQPWRRRHWAPQPFRWLRNRENLAQDPWETGRASSAQTFSTLEPRERKGNSGSVTGVREKAATGSAGLPQQIPGVQTLRPERFGMPTRE